MLDFFFFLLAIIIASVLLFNLVVIPTVQELKICYEQSDQALEKASLHSVSQNYLRDKTLLRSQGEDPQFNQCKSNISAKTNLPLGLVNTANLYFQQKDRQKSLGN